MTAPAALRSLPEICETAKLTNCASCGAGPGHWCLVTGGAPLALNSGSPCPRGCTVEPMPDNHWRRIPELLTVNVDGELSCPTCWECFGILGIHLARFARARAQGLLTAGEFASVIADADVFTGSTVVLAGAA